MDDSEIIKCKNCLSEFAKSELERSCCNCFCCTGCEVYLCEQCKKEIIVKPPGKPPGCQYHNSDL